MPPTTLSGHDNLTDLCAYRKQKSRQRVFNALEELSAEAFQHLAHERSSIDAREFEEFLLQVLGDYLVDGAQPNPNVQQIYDRYERFDARLRQCLQFKLNTLRRFESIHPQNVALFQQP